MRLESKECNHIKGEFKIILDEEGRVVFSKLDFETLKEKFRLTRLVCIGNVLFVSNSIDEYYIEYIGTKLILFHKNLRGNTRSYHRERKAFDNIFDVLRYCKNHYKKYKGFGHSKTYRKSRMEQLFEMI